MAAAIDPKFLISIFHAALYLTQRRREAESAEKVQKSDGKDNHDTNSLGKFSHPIGENEYIPKQWDNLCELCALCASA